MDMVDQYGRPPMLVCKLCHRIIHPDEVCDEYEGHTVHAYCYDEATQKDDDSDRSTEGT